ncbi:MAG: hypothetical protein U1F43_14590 [Myxococcota bacterium]
MSAEPMEVLRLAPLWEIDCGAGDAPVGFGVGPDGELLAVTQDAPIERHVVGAGGSRFAKSRERVGRRLRVVGPDGLRLELADERSWYDFVQPMPDGGTLLVGARTSAHAPDNVAIYGADGRCLRSFGVGDGVAEVQATADGDLWVSYFDQGIFGGAAADGTGLARFSADGALEFAYRGDELGTDDICDCYALNVASAVDTWLYFYTAFELVRLRDGRAKVWRGLPAARAPSPSTPIGPCSSATTSGPTRCASSASGTTAASTSSARWRSPTPTARRSGAPARWAAATRSSCAPSAACSGSRPGAVSHRAAERRVGAGPRSCQLAGIAVQPSVHGGTPGLKAP